MDLQLPARGISDRVSITSRLEPGEKRTFAALDGAGCIRHLWMACPRQEMTNRGCIIRIFFDDQPVPYVEAPVGDFFGVMHGKAWYPVNTRFLSVQAWSGYNCYFPMPFARGARVEFECGPQGQGLYLIVDWHRYPDGQMPEPRRFCARWRREVPTRRYDEAFLMLDADGPGQLLGFAYGVQLIDNTDRWSHGGADNIYIDGQGAQPAYLRGIGGEDTFGSAYGGALHPPETHLHAGMPYYVHEDTGEPRPAQRVVGYRFFDEDEIHFEKSLQFRFGCMQNDICATTYWYQGGIVRPFFSMPPWEHLSYYTLQGPKLDPARSFPRGTYDLPLPDCGAWWLCGPFGNQDERAMTAALPAESAFDAGAFYDASHEDGSRWLTDESKAAGRDRARWVRRPAHHGFIDFNHAFQPHAYGSGVTHPGAAIARCILQAPTDLTARIQIAWDDHLILRVNETPAMDLGQHAAFRSKTVDVPLKRGPNTLVLKLSNARGSNHGGWAFAFHATAPDGTPLLPQAPQP